MLKITEFANPGLKVFNSANNLDKVLANGIHEPLPNKSGFSMVIAGPSGSGKTTLLYSIMSKGKVNKVRQGYLNVFDRIYIISPSIGNDSMSNDPFKSLPEDQIYRELTLETLDEIYQSLKQSRKDGEHSVVILDDVGSQLRKSAKVEKILTQMIQNRRHDYCSYITLVQKYKDLPTGLRNNISTFICFRPKNKLEMDSISDELFPYDKKKNAQILNHIFESEEKNKFFIIDMSLSNSSTFLFYNGFNRLKISL
jgi:nucleoside-triphosphatase THEP1